MQPAGGEVERGLRCCMAGVHQAKLPQGPVGPACLGTLST